MKITEREEILMRRALTPLARQLKQKCRPGLCALVAQAWG
jgi:hypothetical protein